MGDPINEMGLRNLRRIADLEAEVERLQEALDAQIKQGERLPYHPTDRVEGVLAEVERLMKATLFASERIAVLEKALRHRCIELHYGSGHSGAFASGSFLAGDVLPPTLRPLL